MHVLLRFLRLMCVDTNTSLLFINGATGDSSDRVIHVFEPTIPRKVGIIALSAPESALIPANPEIIQFEYANQDCSVLVNCGTDFMPRTHYWCVQQSIQQIF